MLNARSVKLNYERRGIGEPLLLIHGTGSHWQVWEPVLDTLAVRHHVIAVDLPGHGGSEPAPDGTPPTAAGFARLISTFLREELGIESAHVAGNSMGAGRPWRWRSWVTPAPSRPCVRPGSGARAPRATASSPSCSATPSRTCSEGAGRGWQPPPPRDARSSWASTSDARGRFLQARRRRLCATSPSPRVSSRTSMPRCQRGSLGVG